MRITDTETKEIIKLLERLGYSTGVETVFRANDAWIDNTADEILRRKRRECWENDDLYGRDSCAQTRTADSAARVIRALLDKD